MLWHNWSDGYKIKFSYETILFESHTKKEQRRPLRTTPLLQLAITQRLLDSTEAQKFMGLELEELYVPLEIESFTGTRGAPGAHTVTATSTITYHWILANISGLYLIDEDGNQAAIQSVVGSVINLDQDLAGTSTDFWPALKCLVKDVGPSLITDNAIQCSLLLEQIKG